MNHSLSPPTSLNHLNLNKFNYHSQPAHSLHEILQNQFHIKSLEISPHGKTGVVFIETEKGSFVLKSNNQGPIDQFLNKMATLLDLNVPQSICYNCADLQFHKILFQIEKFCARDEMLYARIKSRMDFPFYQIIEYIPSISMAEIGRDRFEAHLLDSIKLYSIGMCLGFDLLTNNSDRFKLIWNGDGNINNVLIQVLGHDSFQMGLIKDRNNVQIQLGSYIFIDHSGYLLDLKNPLAAKNFENYMNKVVDFQINLIRSLSEQYPIPKEFNKLTQQFLLYTHYSLTKLDIHQISKGIIYATHKFIEIFQSKGLEELYNSMKKPTINEAKTRQAKENSYWNDYWNATLNKVNLNYLQEVYTKMAAIYTTYPEIIPKIIVQMEKNVTEQMRPASKVSIEKKSTLQNYEDKPSQNDPESIPTNNLLKSDPQMQSKQQIKTPEKRNSIPQQQESPYSKGQNQGGPQNYSPYQQNEEDKQTKPQPKVRKWRQKLKKFAAENSNNIQNKE